MPFERPHIAQLKARIEADVDGRLIAGDPRLRRDLIKILGQMEAGVAHGLYGGLDWLAKNLLPNTQDPDILKIWADHYHVDRLGASNAIGEIGITGNAGFTIPAGKVYQHASGAQYELRADVSAVGTYATGEVIALTAGAESNLESGETLNLIDPEPGVQSQAVVIAPGITGGADIQPTSFWSDRLAQRLANPPQGGAVSDYEAWSLAAHPAVTNAWAHAATPLPGFVTVYLMTYGNTPTGLPSAVVLDAVKAYVEERRPATANDIYILAPETKTVDMTIELQPNTVDVQTAVRNEVDDLFRREAAPGQAIPLSHLTEAISLSEGETDHRVSVTQADLTPTPSEILVLGEITWEELP
ncbi:Phage FluMu protein gp47 [Alloalcanivorax xenomutans]|uniref:baseplate J/gp47 family protein n=1 Tax=Alloalcanivorax xenomutans TaxID=1094342 RepID=UPI0006D5C4F5|nr:baseplate J/gp47 family protein [Alloalcanivorax xenomutans]CUR45497.1 Phage FluMu protein gp47 [Alloalcanivorax xenomutans]